MLSFRLLNRCVQNKLIHPTIYKFATQSSSSSDSDSEEQKLKTIQADKKKSNEALQKLNVLLKQMIDDDTANTKSKLNLAKPKARARNAQTEPETVSAKSEPVEQQLINAVKNVSESLGGNTRQTESELLSKLLNQTFNSEEESKSKSLNLSDVIAGMKIDRTVKPTPTYETSRAHQVRQLLDRTAGKSYKEDFDKRSVSRRIRPTRSSQINVEKIDLFGAQTLGIFTKNEWTNEEDSVTLKIWNSLQEKELRLTVTHPPENYFQEMILWTEQGKVWKFPIDNEQGMEEEQSVHFSEHVFLEKYLESWCPTKGPIRHFMELVTVGLSKNHYLSAQAKKEHLLWYKDYFLSKKQLLEEIGAMPTDSVKPKEISE